MSLLRGGALVVLALLASTEVAAAADAPSVPYALAVLQALDKVTARVTRLQAPVGEPVRFGSLEITARACLQTPPTEAPESAAFLQIDDIRPGGQEVRHVFSGWMFASSPAISALEHPVYDVWVIDCEKPLPPPVGPTPPGPTGGPPAITVSPLPPASSGTPDKAQPRQNN